MAPALDFLNLLLESEVLRFGSFLTKSGRMSPYFFNTGNIDSGFRLGRAADLYAQTILAEFGSQVTNLFGPAYKGIPLAAVISDRLAQRMNRDVTFTYNRKEKKDHGEGGQMVGHQYQAHDQVLIVEDVLTGGTSLRETMLLLTSQKVNVIGALVGVDRQEKGLSNMSARAEIERDFQIPVRSILSMDQVVAALYNQPVLGKIWIDEQAYSSILEYRKLFSV
ncbi:MAG: orotate phosphoribosyltransferase [Pseudomonadota bacterium]